MAHRHCRWSLQLRQGLDFLCRGREETWKAAALGTSQDMPVYSYSPDFLRSDWKLFHDALQQHRLTVSHEILPRYGICAA